MGGILTRLAMRENWDVIIRDMTRAEGFKESGRARYDITDPDAVKSAVDKYRPQAVVNTAAVSDIDFAEKNQDLTRKVNVEGAANIAGACAKHGIRFVHFSSDAVFDGNSGPYVEEDAPAPVNFYGRSKAEAEAEVFSVCPGAAVIRISLVLGFPVAGGNSFLMRFREALSRGKEQTLPVFEIRTPVDVHTLTEAVLELCENRFTGLIHIGSTDSINRYELAKRAAAKMGFNPDLVKAQPEGAVSKDRAPRHKNGILSVKKARELLSTPMLTVDATIRRAVASP